MYSVQKPRHGRKHIGLQQRKQHNQSLSCFSSDDSFLMNQTDELQNDSSAILDPKDIFFTNLLLLGFDPLQYEDKYKIQFTRLV